MLWTFNEDRAVLERTGRDSELAELLDRPIQVVYRRRFKLRGSARQLGLSYVEITGPNLDRVRHAIERRPEPVPKPPKPPKPPKVTVWCKFCPDCEQGFFTWYNQTKRCLPCARNRTRERSAARMASDEGRQKARLWRRNAYQRDPEKKAAQSKIRDQRYRLTSPDRYRAADRERSARWRAADPERARAVSRRYQARQRGLTLDEFEDLRLMTLATRLAVAEIKLREREASLTERRCPQCGASFTPERWTRTPRMYCGQECYAESVRERSREKGRTLWGTRPLGQRGPSECACCGSPMVALYSTQRYCGPRCQKRAENRRKNRRRMQRRLEVTSSLAAFDERLKVILAGHPDV
jgi:hypothetical protein